MTNNSQLLIYQTPDGTIKIDVHLKEETVWLTQDHMAELFGKAKSTINEHIKNIFAEGELVESEVMKKFGISEFQQKAPNFYNLDVIISVGYRVKSQQGTQFRIWSTQRLTMIQNKLLWAISQQTAAELVYRRADASLPLVGMQSYDKKADIPIRKSDVSIAKNYLKEDEMKLLGLLVEQYLAFAETMALQHTPMYMQDWIQRLDGIIQLNGRELLTHAGKISHSKALEKSAVEYEKYREEQKIVEHEQSLRELEKDITDIEKIIPDEGNKK